MATYVEELHGARDALLRAGRETQNAARHVAAAAAATPRSSTKARDPSYGYDAPATPLLHLCGWAQELEKTASGLLHDAGRLRTVEPLDGDE